MEKMTSQNSQFQEDTRNNQRNTTTSIKNLEVHMGQIAHQIAGAQAQGSLPSSTVTSPIKHNNVSDVTLRNGKSTKSPE